MKECSIETCDRTACKKSMCEKHYMQVRRHGKISLNSKSDKNKILRQGNVIRIEILKKDTPPMYAFTDSKFSEIVSKYKWWLSDRNYVCSKTHSTTTYLHRLILNIPKGFKGDHIDRNTLNNRLNNLRIATQAENCRNRSKGKANKSGFKGVSWSKRRGKWVSSIGVGYKVFNLGFFQDKIEAAEAYNQGAIKYHKEFANINNI